VFAVDVNLLRNITSALPFLGMTRALAIACIKARSDKRVHAFDRYRCQVDLLASIYMHILVLLLLLHSLDLHLLHL